MGVGAMPVEVPAGGEKKMVYKLKCVN